MINKKTYQIVAYNKDADAYALLAMINWDLSLAIEMANCASKLNLKRRNGEPFDWIEVIESQKGIRHHLVVCE